MESKRMKLATVVLIGMLTCAATACGADKRTNLGENLINNEEEEKSTVIMFGPMGKTSTDGENTSRTAQERTVLMAEEALGISVDFNTYTAQDYQEKTYDDVCVERVRSGLDDIYLLNADVIKMLGEEGTLADLSGLESVKNLREVVKTANTINGKLVAIPQEVVAYGLFINQDLFDRYDLKLPETPKDLLECCNVLKKTGLKRQSAQTAGGWKILYWRRALRICIMAAIRRKRLQPLTAAKRN